MIAKRSLADWLFRSDSPEVMNHVDMVYRLNYWTKMNYPTAHRLKEMDHNELKVIEEIIDKLVDSNMIIRVTSDGSPIKNGSKFYDLQRFKNTGFLYHHHTTDPFKLTGVVSNYNCDLEFARSVVGYHSVSGRTVRVIETDRAIICQFWNGNNWEGLHPEMITKLSYKTILPEEQWKDSADRH